ncbi:colorectal mutant cancer protein-like [Tubulanus polymorphus]|uniref:colorectal mutant cancer protein-like n=1 Tax=Tubulanus polymorphus TaxID=672921 RepID=UPI003DA46F8B
MSLHLPPGGSVGQSPPGLARGSSSSGSDSSSTAEEERLRRLFVSCDHDGDGYIDGKDLVVMCQRLNMADVVDALRHELGMYNEGGVISFEEFIKCRRKLMAEIAQVKDQLICDPTDDVVIVSGGDGGGMHDIGSDARRMMAWQNSSDNSLANSGYGYDSGTQDMGPDPPSLHRLLETHEPDCYKKFINDAMASNCLEVANSLHLATISSLKQDMNVVDVGRRLQHVTTERDLLEKQLSKSQTEKLQIQRDWTIRLEQQSLRYEERITELHSVIAELRKKIERHQINIIREEDEEESDAGQSNRSQASFTNDENIALGSQCATSLDLGNDLNAEISRVVSELEQSIESRKKQIEAVKIDVATTTATEPTYEKLMEDNLEDKTVGDQVSPSSTTKDEDGRDIETLSYRHSGVESSADTLHREQIETCRVQIDVLQQQNFELRDQVGRQEVDLNKLKAQLGGLQEEKTKLLSKNKELHYKLQTNSGNCTTSPSHSRFSGSPQHSRTSTPTTPGAMIGPLIPQCQADRMMNSSGDQVPVAKVAELKKLRTSSSEHKLTGVQISQHGLPNAKVAEHLAASLQDCSNLQEIVQAVYQCGNEISENKVQEFEIETDRLNSKIDHFKSQNDLLSITLEESKAHCDRLTVLMGKYESNNLALQLALNYSDQTIEGYEILIALLESEMGVLLSNCRAAGLGHIAGVENLIGQEEIASTLHRTHHSRKIAENVAKQLIHKLDRSCVVGSNSGGYNVNWSASPGPWDENSMGRTASTTSSTGSNSDTEFTKYDEQKLRDHIQQLKSDRAAVKSTVLDLESVHVDPLSSEMQINPDAQRLDLENAVLMQELMAMKEEKSELKSQNYLLDKEKRSLELNLNSKESQEQAFVVQIQHLKSVLKEKTKKCNCKKTSNQDGSDSSSDRRSSTGSVKISDLSNRTPIELAQDLAESLKREKKLKIRVHELVTAMERLSRNAETRHQQSAEFVNDLKRANNALISAFEKAKKKYQSRVRRLETQIDSQTERYETQIKELKQRIALLEDKTKRPMTTANETSL